ALGGALGFMISYGIISAVNLMGIEKYVGELTISPINAAISLLTLGFIGMAAGWFPAKRAAGLDPVIAIRA
ncbi:MAG: ABC transporter permease, partial [Calditrichaceae bacterium]